MYETQLKDLGLTDNEVKIYLALLRSGPLNPYQLADKLGMHRGYIYDSLERMQEKNVISTILINNKKNFQAVSPANLIELIKFKLNEMQKILPELQKLASIEKQDTKVGLHKGRHTFQNLLKDALASAKKGDVLYSIGVDEDILAKEVEPIYMQKFFNSPKYKTIKEKIIISPEKKRLNYTQITYRWLPKELIGNTMQFIYAHKVAIFILGTPYYLIVIENKEVADTYRRQFEALWGLSKAF